MKVVMCMFDSLNRRFLQPYNEDTFVKTPNFQRLSKQAVTFDNSYICSMACMPARRDFHTGRPNFLHTGWGPLQPFDDSVPQMLSDAGIYTHLASDHYHYWEDGAGTYHNRYTSWQNFRGQEGESYIGKVGAPDMPPILGKNSNNPRQHCDQRNRQAVWNGECKHSQRQTFDAGLKFIQQNSKEDNWFVQIECFDPHEPFFSEDDYQKQYPTNYDGPRFDWPSYGEVKQTKEQVAEARRNSAALTTQCDASLGRVLDLLDKNQMWEDTMLIVWTDHGFTMGEHNMWGKSSIPYYQEVANTPFFIWDPRCKKQGQRRNALVQPSIDLGPTLLRFFGQEPTKDMLGKDLARTIEQDEKVRDAAIFGLHGMAVNITDGRYVYMRNRSADKDMLYSYTLMPTKMRGFLDGNLLENAKLVEPFSFTKGQKLLKLGPIPQRPVQKTTLWDLHKDPDQKAPIEDEDVEKRLKDQMISLMREADAPKEQYERLSLS